MTPEPLRHQKSSCRSSPRCESMPRMPSRTRPSSWQLTTNSRVTGHLKPKFSKEDTGSSTANPAECVSSFSGARLLNCLKSKSLQQSRHSRCQSLEPRAATLAASPLAKPATLPVAQPRGLLDSLRAHLTRCTRRRGTASTPTGLHTSHSHQRSSTPSGP